MTFSHAASLVGGKLDRRSQSSMTMLTSVADDDTWEVDDVQEEAGHVGSRFAVRDSNFFRAIWELIVAMWLVYTGTVFLFRVCFVDFHVPEPILEGQEAWQVVDNLMTAVFWVDLFINFVFTYRDARGVEIDSFRLIAIHYLKGYFWVNLIACTPVAVVRELACLSSNCGSADGPTGHVAPVIRLVRLQRLSRLARLPRLVEISQRSKCRPYMPRLRWLGHTRWVRVMNNAVGLLWAVHLFACGWYLCAALHTNPHETWVGRRSVDTDGDISLLTRPPMDQWVHSCYFILTVFTTVGFGDMSAVTLGEIVYVCFAMIVGIIVNSMIISEVISIVTSRDKVHEYIEKNNELVEAFTEHTQLDETSKKLMTAWISYSAKGWMSYRYDREEVKALIINKCMPRSLLGRLPKNLFGGTLMRNRFLTLGGGAMVMPPRLPVLLALAVHRVGFDFGEIVYQMHDLAMSAFLVISGVFADVGRPAPQGGVDDAGQFGLTAGGTLAQDRQPAEPRVLNRLNTMEAMRAKVHTQHLFPYKLYGHGNYFGLAEVLDSIERSCSVRCESEVGGTVLVLPKTELQSLMAEFPHFAMAWRSQSRRRERHRLQMLSRLTVGMNHRRLAAVRIQKAMRARRRRCSLHLESSTDLSSAAFAARLVAQAPRTQTECSSVGDCSPAAEAQIARRLLSVCEAQARDMRELRSCVDGMRSDFVSFQKDVWKMFSTTGGERRRPSLQGAAYAVEADEMTI